MAIDSTSIGQRYEILDLLGTGGMGSVYRAYDRLSGQTVALKRVAVAPRPAADTSSLLLALAQEFRLLASLRHPHIISVFDYGFDSARQPYFTMELLDQPQTLRFAPRTIVLALTRSCWRNFAGADAPHALSRRT